MASSTEVLHDLTVDSVIRGYHVYKLGYLGSNYWRDLICEQEPGNENRFAAAGHQLLKYLGTFNWKIWLARRTLEQITINSLKVGLRLLCSKFYLLFFPEFP